MLQRSKPLLKIRSHTRPSNRHPLGGAKHGREYNMSFKRYACGGWGIGTYSVGKDRRYMPKDIYGVSKAPKTPKNSDVSIGDGADRETSYTRTTKSLSAQFRPFALDDGGVLFVHPTHKQVMEWGSDAMKKERELTAERPAAPMST